MEVVFDAVLGRAPASQQADVAFTMPFLVTSMCAPPVPKGAEGSGTNSRWGELLKQLQVGQGTPSLPCWCVLSAGGVGWGRVFTRVMELPSLELSPVLGRRIVPLGLQ